MDRKNIGIHELKWVYVRECVILIMMMHLYINIHRTLFTWQQELNMLLPVINCLPVI